mmetsp:Transcript_27849/g.42126  ORF Transcript_27849/g.42126 Transcript_27849/m.42126 type:complete len:104 (-) Transcript_27849:43-354(-)
MGEDDNSDSSEDTVNLFDVEKGGAIRRAVNRPNNDDIKSKFEEEKGGEDDVITFGAPLDNPGSYVEPKKPKKLRKGSSNPFKSSRPTQEERALLLKRMDDLVM